MNRRVFEQLLDRSTKDLATLTEAHPDDAKLAAATQDLAQLFIEKQVGLASRHRTLPRWQLAIENLRQWMAGASSAWGGGISGGDTSDPTHNAAAARVEYTSRSGAEAQLGMLFDQAQVLVAQLDEWLHPKPGEKGETDEKKRKRLADAVRDHRRLIAHAAKNMSRIVAVATTPLDLSQIPDDLPGCRSCARTQGKKGKEIGGHHAEVREDVKGHGLCDWCYRHALADGKARDLGELGDPPPIRACHIFHTEGRRKAGLWMARYLEGRGQKVTA